VAAGIGPSTPLRLAVAFGVALAAGLAFHSWRGYAPQLAAIAGAAVGILAFLALRAAERLARLWRR
jgi:hypothetical protein